MEGTFISLMKTLCRVTNKLINYIQPYAYMDNLMGYLWLDIKQNSLKYEYFMALNGMHVNSGVPVMERCKWKIQKQVGPA